MGTLFLFLRNGSTHLEGLGLSRANLASINAWATRSLELECDLFIWGAEGHGKDVWRVLEGYHNQVEAGSSSSIIHELIFNRNSGYTTISDAPRWENIFYLNPDSNDRSDEDKANAARTTFGQQQKKKKDDRPSGAGAGASSSSSSNTVAC